MSFKVAIDDHKEKYIPGQSIVGRIICSLTEERYVEARIQIVGEEYTAYHEKSTNRAEQSRGWKSKFLESKNVLIRSGDLAMGNHEFPFKVTLPKYIPSSYNCRYGYVKFYIKASMQSYGVTCCEDEVEFKVFSPIDLNDIINLWLVPNRYYDDLTVDRWFCMPDSILMEVDVPKNAFIIGELIKVDVVLSNNSPLNISEVRAKLIVRVQAKVATPRQEFLDVNTVLASIKLSGVKPRRSKSLPFQFSVPINAELPNFEKCSLFTKNALIEIIAETEDTSKPNLKVQVDVVLGHFPVDRNGSLTNNTKDKKRPDPVIISPLEYGFSGNIREGSPRSIPSNYPSNVPVSNPHIPQSTPNKAPIAPYGVNANRMPVLPQVPSHPISLHSSFEVPSPVGLYERRRSGPYTDSNEIPSSLKKTVPSAASRIPKDKDAYSLKNKSTIPPYPVEASSPSSGDQQPPYHPYPTHNKLVSPYPLENNCPYPTNNAKTNLPYPSSSSLSHPKEELGSNLPYLKETSCPYPTQDKKTVAPYPITTNPPYPKEPSSRSRPSSFDRERPPYPVEDRFESSTNMPMPPNSRNSSFERLQPPYPIEEGATPSGMPMPSGSRHGSFEKEKPPYPVAGELESSTNISMLSGSRSASFDKDRFVNPSESRSAEKPPYPACIPLLIKPNPPYPTVESSAHAVGNTAPYPPEKLPVHSSLGFPEFMPMPMPSRKSPIPCDTIGFAVSTSSEFKESQPVPPPLITLPQSSIDQPSAPPAIPSPPIASIDEIEDPELTEDDSIPSPVLSLYENNRGASAEVPLLPELPTPPAGEVEVPCGTSSESKDITPPPSYDETVSLINKKGKRPQLKKQLAL